MVAVDYFRSDTMEFVTKTALGLCFMITDLRDVLI